MRSRSFQGVFVLSKNTDHHTRNEFRITPHPPAFERFKIRSYKDAKQTVASERWFGGVLGIICIGVFNGESSRLSHTFPADHHQDEFRDKGYVAALPDLIHGHELSFPNLCSGILYPERRGKGANDINEPNVSCNHLFETEKAFQRSKSTWMLPICQRSQRCRLPKSSRASSMSESARLN